MGRRHRAVPRVPASSVRLRIRCRWSKAPSRDRAREVTVVPGDEVLPATLLLPLSGTSSCRTPGAWAYRDGHDDDRLLRLGRLDPGRGEPGDRRHLGGLPGIRPSRRPSLASTTRRTGAACCGIRPRTCTTPTPRRSSSGRRASGSATSSPLEADLTIQDGGEPLGERIVVTGRVLDGQGRPVAGQLVEIWQANAGGRYIHKRDQHPAPLDPHFTGVGRCLTGPDGAYRFQTIKPGPYPWKNHHNAWRPAHIHFSLFGTDFTQRMVTQMYFPGDPLFALDPIYQAITDQRARDRLVATYDHDVTQHEWVDRVPLGHRPHGWPAHPDGGVVTDLVPTPGPDRRAVLRVCAAVRPRQRAGAAVAPVGGAAPRPGDRRPRASESRTRCSSSGRPHPTVPWCSRTVRCAATAGRSPVGAARPPMPTGTTRFTTLRPGSDRGRPGAVLRRHRVRPRAAEPALHPCLPPRRRGGPGRRPAARVARRRTAARRWCAVADEHGYAFDVRLQGDDETVFLRYPGQ